MAIFRTILMAAIVLPALSKDSFTDIPPDEAVQGSAMLQTSAKAGPRGVMLQKKSSPVSKSSPAAHGFVGKSKSECGAFGAKSYVKQSRSCLPLDLQERHLQAIRHHAALVAMGSRSLSDISLLAAKAATGTKPNSSKSHSAMKSRSLPSRQGPPDIENQIPTTSTTEEPEEEDSGPAGPPDIENQIPTTTTTTTEKPTTTTEK